MATALRFPLGLPAPLREGFEDTHEETRSRVEMELGTDRVRNRTRSAPRVFSVRWIFDRDQYQTFDDWWQNSIKGGAEDFDIQLIDDEDVVAWFTCNVVQGTYNAEVVNDFDWQVSATLRTLEEPFYVRPAGTDELGANQLFQFKGTANLLVIHAFHGSATFGLTLGAGTLEKPPIGALGTITFTSNTMLEARPFWASGFFEFTTQTDMIPLGDPELILQFDAVVYAEPSGDAVVLKFDDVLYLPPRVEV